MARKPTFGHEAFEVYTRKIVANEQFAEMPDVYGKKNTIQWEAPSNRSSGEFQYTHRDRLEWWKRKAASLGISTTENNWISRTAKLIHPYKKKPCKSCGLELYIAYRYPKKMLIDRIKKIYFLPKNFEISHIDDICNIVDRLYEACGARIFEEFPNIFNTSSIKLPVIKSDIESWKKYLIEEYVVQEPATLSPGAMSNAPDRFDGFHSFNRCCRGTADKGRSKENLQTYSTDRRTFEYWVDGDWVAADGLMALVRSVDIFRVADCFNVNRPGNHPSPCQADHIGPISLGFTHRPHFQLLCKSCNSAKNNRMYASDVWQLIEAEQRGEIVVSWFAKEIWERRKQVVKNNSDALRLSKLMRDNRHTYMALLRRVLESGSLTFLVSLLSLDYADRTPEFINLRVSEHVTDFDAIKYTLRTNKYTIEQKARRIRIAFSALVEYQKKENRNEYVISSELIEREINSALILLGGMKYQTENIDHDIERVVLNEVVSEHDLRILVEKISLSIGAMEPNFRKVRSYLSSAMSQVGVALADLWEDDRYHRGNDLDDTLNLE